MGRTPGWREPDRSHEQEAELQAEYEASVARDRARQGRLELGFAAVVMFVAFSVYPLLVALAGAPLVSAAMYAGLAIIVAVLVLLWRWLLRGGKTKEEPALRTSAEADEEAKRLRVAELDAGLPEEERDGAEEEEPRRLRR